MAAAVHQGLQGIEEGQETKTSRRKETHVLYEKVKRLVV